MTQGVPRNNKRFVAALIVGAVVGIMVGTAIRHRIVGLEVDAVPNAGAAALDGSPVDEAPLSTESIESGVAWQYALACRDGNWVRVVGLTCWMQDRLAHVLKNDGPNAVPLDRDRLVADLGTRTVADNRLADEGVEDPYIFSPGAKIAYDSVDAGRESLDAPVARRTWLRVEYPVREKAPLDREGVPIRSLRVGINVSSEGFVLKGNVIGNLDIDWESIKYDWPLR